MIKVSSLTFVRLLLAGVALLQCSVGRAASPGYPWPQFGIDPAGRRQSSFSGPVTLPSVKWTFSTGGSVYATPAIDADSILYVPSYDGNFYAISADGSLSWSHTLGGQLRGSAAFSSTGNLLLLGVNGYYAFAPDGTPLSTNAALGGADPSVTVADDGTTYVGNNTSLHAFDAAGSELWEYPVSSLVQGTPVIGNGGDIYFATSDGELRAVSNLGVTKWLFYIPGQNVKSATVGVDGTIYAGGQLGDFFAINPNGTEKWRFSLPDGISIYTAAALGFNNDIIFAATDGIYSVNQNGQLNWRYADLSFGHGSVFVDAAGNIFGTRNNHVIALNPSGSLLWDLEIASADYVQSSVTVDKNGVLYVGTDNGVVALAVPEPSTFLLLAPAAFIAWARFNRPRVLRLHQRRYFRVA